MAHELTFRQGVAETFQVLTPAWHREGHLLETAPDFDTAIRLAGLNFTVEKIPTKFVQPIMDQAGNVIDTVEIKSKSAYVVVRTDTYQELGGVGAGYTPLQNADAFRAIEPLLDTGIMKLETGGSLREGADCWLLGKFDLDRFGPVCQEVFNGEVIPYVLITTNHSGRRCATVSLTPIRVVCANTLGYTEMLADNGMGGVQEIKVQHTGEAPKRMIEASEKLVGGIIARYELLAKHYKALKATMLTDEQFKSLVLDVVSPDPRKSRKFNPEAKLAELVIKRHEQRIELVTQLWHAGAGHVGDRSAWEAYNGTVQAIDHNEDVFPVRGGAWRTQSLLDGKLGQLKKAVLDNLAQASGLAYEQAEAVVSTI